MSGKELYTSKREISREGRTLTETMNQKEPKLTGVAVWRKMSDGNSSNPLIGTWHVEPGESKVESSSYTLTLERSGDGLKIMSPGSECAAAFDGREHPVTGKLIGNARTMTLKAINDRAFEQILNRNGKTYSIVRNE